MAQLIARFAVTGWEPRTIEGVEESWAGAVQMRKTYTSGLTGESVALFVSSGIEEGQRSYFAAERITAATEDGRTGSVTVHHGALESEAGTPFGHVVPGSGTDDFADWAGSAHIEHDEGGAYFVFELP